MNDQHDIDNLFAWSHDHQRLEVRPFRVEQRVDGLVDVTFESEAPRTFDNDRDAIAFIGQVLRRAAVVARPLREP